MLRTLALVGLCVALVLCVGGLMAADQPQGKVFEGSVKGVDSVKSTITITAKDGKDHTFAVAADAKVYGPKGKVSKDGLTDKRLTNGTMVSVNTGPNGKTASAIHIAAAPK